MGGEFSFLRRTLLRGVRRPYCTGLGKDPSAASCKYIDEPVGIINENFLTRWMTISYAVKTLYLGIKTCMCKICYRQGTFCLAGLGKR
jgi:hypothetical protein